MSSMNASLWSDDHSTSFGASSYELPVIPTPPRSPPTDGLLSMNFHNAMNKFSNGGMVNPNSILDEVPRSNDPSLSSLNVDYTVLDPFDIKDETFDSYLADEFNLNDCLCPHGHTQSFCNACFDDNFKTEIVNDCMWTAGSEFSLTNNECSKRATTVAPTQHKPIATSLLSTYPGIVQNSSHTLFSSSNNNNNNNSSSNTTTSSKVRFDSMLSMTKFDIIADPMARTLDADDFTCKAPKLETPSESSDTDTDVEEISVVHLDHNYHNFNNPNKEEIPDAIASPLRKALTKVKAHQHESDDEIDVVNFGSNDTLALHLVAKKVPTKLCGGLVNVKNVVKEERCGPMGSPTPHPVTKRGRKPGTRKVGRPCKSVKRLSAAKGPKPFGKRGGNGNHRTTQMDPSKRKLHNSMERKRRVDLKNCFDAVRCNVPDLQEKARAPKVVILNGAAKLLRQMEAEDMRLIMEKERLTRYQNMLLLKLQKLRAGWPIAEAELG